MLTCLCPKCREKYLKEKHDDNDFFIQNLHNIKAEQIHEFILKTYNVETNISRIKGIISNTFNLHLADAFFQNLQIHIRSKKFPYESIKTFNRENKDKLAREENYNKYLLNKQNVNFPETLKTDFFNYFSKDNC